MHYACALSWVEREEQGGQAHMLPEEVAMLAGRALALLLSYPECPGGRRVDHVVGQGSEGPGGFGSCGAGS